MAILNKDTLRVIMVGATHVVDMGGKTAFIHYETETTAHMLLPDGTRYDGDWDLLDDGYRVAWTNGPTGPGSSTTSPARSTMSMRPAAVRGRDRAHRFRRGCAASGLIVRD